MLDGRYYGWRSVNQQSSAEICAGNSTDCDILGHKYRWVGR